ncbi:hypothetical protein SC171_21415 [Pantoea cypripedii]|uniref:hypothetical protein n=1 Tax=Pantoea cypripedii TaxID=55209 RepID=UPI002FC7851F
MAINNLSNTNTSAIIPTDTPATTLKTSAEPDYHDYRLSRQAEAHFDHIAERFHNDSDWSQNKEVKQLLDIIARDENFQARMQQKNLKMEDPASVNLNAATDKPLCIDGRAATPHEKLLLALLQEPENKTELELQDLTAQLKDELQTHSQKYAVLLTRATHSEMTQHVELKNPPPLAPEAKERIGYLLKAASEYSQLHDTPTYATTLELDQEWLAMKDAILVTPGKPLAQDIDVDNLENAKLLAVPAAVGEKVQNIQEAIRELEQVVKTEWPSVQQKRADNQTRCRMNGVIQSTGRALAESMTAVSKAAEVEKPEELYRVHEEGVLTLMARDALDILGDVQGRKFLEEDGRKEMELYESENPAAEPDELRAKMIDVLSEQFKKEAENNEGLKNNIKEATEKAIKVYRKSREDALVKSYEKIRHAKLKSRRFRTELLEKVRDDSVLRNKPVSPHLVVLMQAMQKQEMCLRAAQAELKKQKPGLIKNVKTFGTEAGKAFKDLDLTSGASKALDVLKRAPRAFAGLARMIDKAIADPLKRALDDSNFSTRDQAELSSLMVPLESVAKLVSSFADPLVTSAASLKRIRSKTNRAAKSKKKKQTDKAEMATLDGSAPKTPSGKMCKALLDAMLAKKGKVARRENKQEGLEEKVAKQVADLQRALPYIRQQLGAEFEKKGAAIETSYLGDERTRDYFLKVKFLRDKYMEVFTEMENKVNLAAQPARKGDPKAAQELYNAANELKELSTNLSRHINTISSEELGYEFGYDEFDKVIVQDLLSYAAKELVEGFDEWTAVTPQGELNTAALKDKLQHIMTHIKAEITKPERDVLKRDKDPNNAVLVAALDQEFSNMLNRLQDKAPTLNELLAQTPNCTDIFMKKCQSKAVSGLIYGALSLATDGALLSGLIESAMGMTQFQRFVNPLRHRPVIEQFYQLYDSSKKGKVQARLFEIKDEYNIKKLKFRRLTKLMVNVVSVFIPAFAALPFTLPVALYGAATRPKAFIDNVKSGLFMDATIAGGFELFSEYHETQGKISVNAKVDHYEHTKSSIRRAMELKEPITLDMSDEQNVRAYIEAFRERVDQLKQEKEAKKKEIEKQQALQKEDEENELKPKNTNHKNISVKMTEKEIDQIKKQQSAVSIDGSYLHATDGQTPLKRTAVAPLAEETAVTESPSTQGSRVPTDAEIDDQIEASLNEALEEAFPVPEDTEGVIDDPIKWIDNYNHNTLKSKGIPPNLGDSYDWDERIEVWETSGEPETEKLRGYKFEDDKLHGTVTFREYAMGQHLKKGWGDGSNFKYVPVYNTERARNMLDALNKTNLQKDYIAAVGNYFEKPEVKEMAKVVSTAQLKMAVSEHKRYSNSPVGYDLNKVLRKIENGDVKTLKIDGCNVADMAVINTDGANGYIFVSLRTGKVYEVTKTEGTGNFQFKNKAQATECAGLIWSGLSYFNMKDNKPFEINDDGTINSVKTLEQYEQGPEDLVGGARAINAARILLSNEQRIEFSSDETSFQDQLYSNKVKNLKSDIDSAIYSPGEQEFDKWIDIVGTAGTWIGVFALPFTGGLSGLGVSTSAKVLGFLSSAGFSAGLTLATGVMPKLLQAAVATDPEERDAYLNDAFMAILGEGMAYGAGKAASKISVEGFRKFLNKIASKPVEYQNRLVKAFNARRDNFLRRIGKEVDDISLRSAGSNGSSVASSNITAGSSNRSFGSGSEYDSFSFADEGEGLNKIKDGEFRRIAKRFDADINKYTSRHGEVGASALQNEQKYRTMKKLLEQNGYKVQVGYVSVTNQAGSTSKNIVLKVSKADMEDGYIYFKDNVQGGNPGVSGTAFNEDHGGKVFNSEDFAKNYASDMDINNDYVNIRWNNTFTDPGASIPPAEIINTPEWKTKTSIESLESKNSARRGGNGEIEPDDFSGVGRDGLKGNTINKTSVETVGKAGGLMKDQAAEDYAARSASNPVTQPPAVTVKPNDPVGTEVGDAKSFSELSDKVDATSGSLVRFKKTPEGTVVVGTSLHMIGPSADNNTANITVYNESEGKTNASSLSSNPNTDVGKAVNRAVGSAALNYADNQNRITNGTSDANDQELVDHASKIKTTFGLDSNEKVQNLRSPVILVVDTSKIPGYTPGTPLPNDIPKNAIIGVIAEEDRVEETAIYFKKLTGRNIPVKPIQVELKGIDTVYVTWGDETWNDVIDNMQRQNPGLTKRQVYDHLRQANAGKLAQYPELDQVLPNGLALKKPGRPAPAQLQAVTPAQPQTVTSVQSETPTATPVEATVPETSSRLAESTPYKTGENGVQESYWDLGVKFQYRFPGESVESAAISIRTHNVRDGIYPQLNEKLPNGKDLQIPDRRTFGIGEANRAYDWQRSQPAQQPVAETPAQPSAPEEVVAPVKTRLWVSKTSHTIGEDGDEDTYQKLAERYQHQFPRLPLSVIANIIRIHNEKTMGKNVKLNDKIDDGTVIEIPDHRYSKKHLF